MARQKMDWHLPLAANDGSISTKESAVKITVKAKDGSKKEFKGNVTIVGRVSNLQNFRTHAEAVINKGKKESEQIKLTHEYLLAEFVNDNILTNFKQNLRMKADPEKAIATAIAKLRATFKGLAQDKVDAMAAMLRDSMKADLS